MVFQLVLKLCLLELHPHRQDELLNILLHLCHHLLPLSMYRLVVQYQQELVQQMLDKLLVSR